MPIVKQFRFSVRLQPQMLLRNEYQIARYQRNTCLKKQLTAQSYRPAMDERKPE